MGDNNNLLIFFSNVCGWLYTIMWSFSNIPQVYWNFKRQSVSGFSIEFQFWNMLGFLYYFIYTILGFYFQHKWHLTHSIAYQDIIFAVCTFTTVYIIAFQALILYPETISGNFHIVHKILMIILLVIGVYNIFLGIGGYLVWFSHSEDAYAYSVIQYLGIAKSFVSFVKYLPQAYLNFKLQSTYGYNILNVGLDFGGGIFSFLQMFINAYAYPHGNGDPNWEHIFSNVPKLFLAIESMTFDIIFFSQHFILYAHNNQQQEYLEVNNEDNVDDSGSSNDNIVVVSDQLSPSSSYQDQNAQDIYQTI